MARLTVLISALALTALPATTSAGRFDERPQKGVLVALLLPFSDGQDSRMTAKLRVRGDSASLRAYGSGLEPGRFSWGVSNARACKASPKLLGARFGAFRATDEDIEVENEETHWVGRSRARTIVLVRGRGDRAEPVACGRLAGPRGAIARLSGADHTALAALQRSRNRLRLRVAVECARRGDCRRLMEQEGIFYFALQPCGTSAAAGDERFTVDRASSQTGDGQLLGNLVFSAPRAPAGARSLRLALDGEQLACGALR